MDKIPPSRFPDIPIEQAKGRWWIAKVKPRQEKQLAFDFLEHGIEYYLPLYKKLTIRPGTNKKRYFSVPLFPGYICFAQNVPQDIFRTGRVVNLIEIKNQNRFIKEISAIYMASEHGLVVEPVTKSAVVQSQVEVISGVLKGIQGVVTSIKDQLSLILEVNGLGSAAVHIDISQVRILA